MNPFILFTAGVALTTSMLTAQTPAPTLVAHWLYDEEDGTTILDHSGNNNTAEILAPDHVGRAGSPLPAAPEDMPGLYFDGLEGEAPDEPHGHVESTALGDQLFEPTFTVSLWIQPEALPENFAPILTKTTDPETWDDGFGLYISESGELNFHLSQPLEGEAPDEPPAGHARVSAWTHLCLTFDGETAKFYLNGQLRTTSEPDPDFIVNAAPVRLGTLLTPHSPFLTPPSPYRGLIADTRIYDAALSDADVLDLFASTPVAELVDSLDQGIPDLWALFFGLNPFDSTLASQILKTDGFTNLQKYRLGMNPTKTAQVSPKLLLRVYTPLEK